jgi:hypothetical protein
MRIVYYITHFGGTRKYRLLTVGSDQFSEIRDEPRNHRNRADHFRAAGRRKISWTLKRRVLPSCRQRFDPHNSGWKALKGADSRHGKAVGERWRSPVSSRLPVHCGARVIGRHHITAVISPRARTELGDDLTQGDQPGGPPAINTTEPFCCRRETATLAQEREWTLMTGCQAHEAATHFHRCDGERT